MIKSLLQEQRQYIDYFFEHIDVSKIEKIIQVLLNCEGSLIVSGVGKSGIIANKLAMTLLSTGTKAFYMTSVDALHGDIGIVSKEDICILFSKSGETRELIQLIPYVRKKGAKLISVVSNAESKIAILSDLFIVLPVQKELCPFNLAPTTSTVVQMIFGDIIAVALMKNKRFSLDEYAKNHPAGTIGKKISLSVENIMLKGKQLPICKKQDKIIDVLTEISSKKCGTMIVVGENNTLEGVFTDGDLRRAIENHGSKFLEKKIQDLMTATPLWTTPDTLAWNAMKQMEKDPKKLITTLPVIKEKKVVGLVRMHDIVQAGLSE